MIQENGFHLSMVLLLNHRHKDDFKKSSS